MKNLTFAWPRCKPLFNQFNLQIERHQKTYIAGASGSGKSTLLNLISGLLKPSSGSVLLDNVEQEIYSNNEISADGTEDLE